MKRVFDAGLIVLAVIALIVVIVGMTAGKHESAIKSSPQFFIEKFPSGQPEMTFDGQKFWKNGKEVPSVPEWGDITVCDSKRVQR